MRRTAEKLPGKSAYRIKERAVSNKRQPASLYRPGVGITKIAEEKGHCIEVFQRSDGRTHVSAKAVCSEESWISVLEAENKALKKSIETSGGKPCESKSGESRKVPAQFSAPNKDKHVTRVKNRYPSLMGNTEYQQTLSKYRGFYRMCVNCGKSDLKNLPCGCGKKGAESSDSKIREMHAAFKKYRDFQFAAQKGAK